MNTNVKKCFICQDPVQLIGRDYCNEHLCLTPFCKKPRGANDATCEEHAEKFEQELNKLKGARLLSNLAALLSGGSKPL